MKQLYLLLVLLAPALTNAQTASFTSTASTVCQDSCITFVNTSTGTIDSIRWSAPGYSITNPHSDTITVCFSSAGNETIKLYVYSGGHADSSSQLIAINQMPHPRLIDSLPCGLYVPDIYSSYVWYYVSLAISAAGDSTNYIAGTFGSDAFVIVDSNGCYGSSDTLGGCLATGVSRLNKTTGQLQLYPNPADDELTITGMLISDVTIYNLLGQPVYHNTYNSYKVILPVAHLPNGLYYVKVNDGDVKKFEKE